MAEIKKNGHLQVKEDGLRAWIWSKRYVVLREQTITFHRSEVDYIHTHTNCAYCSPVIYYVANWSVCCTCFLKRNNFSNKIWVKIALLWIMHKVQILLYCMPKWRRALFLDGRDLQCKLLNKRGVLRLTKFLISVLL
jgi:hypothetical protein